MQNHLEDKEKKNDELRDANEIGFTRVYCSQNAIIENCVCDTRYESQMLQTIRVQRSLKIVSSFDAQSGQMQNWYWERNGRGEQIEC